MKNTKSQFVSDVIENITEKMELTASMYAYAIESAEKYLKHRLCRKGQISAIACANKIIQQM